MTDVQNINTIDLLNTRCDAIYIIFHSIFRLLKPVRRKYHLSVNSLIVLNSCFLYHKYKGSLFTVNAIFMYLGYYDKNRLKWYFQYLIDHKCIMLSDVIKTIQYYKITEIGLKVMNDFNESYQSVLYKWLEDKNISL